MPGFSGELDGALGDPAQEARWRTEQFANARAERARQVMRRRQLLNDPTDGEALNDSTDTD